MNSAWEPRRTSFPVSKDLLVWDGTCGFCKYWIARWKRITGDRIEYQPYQEAAERYPDIQIGAFREAVHLILRDGRVYSGAHAVSATLNIAGRPLALRLYEGFLIARWVMNGAYIWIAAHRPLSMRITRLLFGSNPEQLRHWWLIWLAVTMVLAAIVAFGGILP